MTTGIGARPLTEDERDAVVLYLEHVPLEAIAARTDLSLARIAAAVDQTRVQAQAVWQPAAKATATPVEPRVRIRRAAPSRPAVALAPPMQWPSTYAASGGELTDRPRAVPPAAEALPAVLEPGSQLWTELATDPAVRAWATADGWIVPTGDRLPGAIILAYHRAHGGAL